MVQQDRQQTAGFFGRGRKVQILCPKVLIGAISADFGHAKKSYYYIYRGGFYPPRCIKMNAGDDDNEKDICLYF